MSPRLAQNDSLVLGGVPRVHLLPREVDERRKARSFRRNLLAVLLGVIVLVALGIAYQSYELVAVDSGESAQQTRQAAIAAELRKYGAVTGIQTQIGDIKTVQPIATAGEILWAPYFQKLQATLPGDTVITGFTAKLDPATTSPPATTNPLVGAHVATLAVSALGPQSSISAWLARLSTLEGVVDATPGAVAIGPDGSYTVNVNLLIGDDVVAHRFAAEEK